MKRTFLSLTLLSLMMVAIVCCENNSGVDKDCANVAYESFLTDRKFGVAGTFSEKFIDLCCRPNKISKTECEKFSADYLKAKKEEEKKLGY